MRVLKGPLGVVILMLAFTPGLAAAQSPSANSPLVSRGLPLEQYTASLGVATPAGEMRKATPPWSWRARVTEIGDGQQRAAPTSTWSSSSAAAVQCPMPIVRPDTTVGRPLPVLMVPLHDAESTAVPSSAVGVIRGCENPLATTR